MMKIKRASVVVIHPPLHGHHHQLSGAKLSRLMRLSWKRIHFTTQEYSMWWVFPRGLLPSCSRSLARRDFLPEAGFMLFVVSGPVANCLHGFATGAIARLLRGLLASPGLAIPAGIRPIAIWFPLRNARSPLASSTPDVARLHAGAAAGDLRSASATAGVGVLVTGALGFVSPSWWVFFPHAQRSILR